MRRLSKATLLISEDRPTLHLRLPVAFMAAESASVCARAQQQFLHFGAFLLMDTYLLHFNCRRHLLRFRIFLLSNLILVLFVPSTRARTEERGGDSNRGAIMTPLTYRAGTGDDIGPGYRQRSVSHSSDSGR